MILDLLRDIYIDPAFVFWFWIIIGVGSLSFLSNH